MENDPTSGDLRRGWTLDPVPDGSCGLFGIHLPALRSSVLLRRFVTTKPLPDFSTYDRDGLIDHLEIAPYDPAWATAFEAERDRLARVLGTLARRIDHNGSTSVCGLAAKPTIDIQVSVDALQPFDVYGQPLSALGYTHVPHADDAVCPFFHRPQTWPHTHHVHVVSHGGVEERRTLAFRDYLRDHADVMRDYAALKQRLAPRYSAADPSTREAYAAAKAEFIERIIQRALTAGYPHPS